MPAYPTQIHVICCQRKPYFVLLESKSRKLLCIDDICLFFLSQITLFLPLWLFSIHSGALWWTASPGDVTLLCFSFLFFCKFSFPSFVCVPAQLCFSECVQNCTLWSCASSDALQLQSDTFVIVLNKTLIHVKRCYYRSKLYEQMRRLALFLGPLATSDVIFTFLEVQFVSL